MARQEKTYVRKIPDNIKLLGCSIHALDSWLAVSNFYALCF